MIRPAFQNLGMYIFLISVACVYYVVNTPFMLGHYDLGWHLAAGDLIRERGNIPFQDPWSFTLEDKRWYNLSWAWDVIASVLFQYTGFSGLIIPDLPVEEAGELAELARRSDLSLILLTQILNGFSAAPVLPFDAAASAVVDDLRAQRSGLRRWTSGSRQSPCHGA